MKKNQRKIVLINPKVQLRIILFFSVAFLISQAVIFYSIYYFFNEFRQLGLEAGFNQDHIFFQFINEQHSDLNTIMIIVSISLLLLFIIGGYELSHRIVGPMYRLTQDLPKIDKDNQIEIKFRKGDNFSEVADAVNDLVKRLK